MARLELPRYLDDKAALLRIFDGDDLNDFDIMLRLQEGGYLSDTMELTDKGRAAAALLSRNSRKQLHAAL
jgi:hypothetical protein